MKLARCLLLLGLAYASARLFLIWRMKRDEYLYVQPYRQIVYIARFSGKRYVQLVKRWDSAEYWWPISPVFERAE